MLSLVLDASAKTSSGFLVGTVSSFGDYDQCLNINTQEEGNNLPTGQYCTIKLEFQFGEENSTNNELSSIQSLVMNRVPMFNYYYKQIGLCLPSACSVDDVNLIIEQSKLKYWFYFVFITSAFYLLFHLAKLLYFSKY